MKHSDGFLRLVNEARARIRETNVAEIKRRLDAGETIALVDTREESEWARGHLPDAVHLSKGIIERDVERRFPEKNAELVLSCEGRFIPGICTETLQNLG